MGMDNAGSGTATLLPDGLTNKAVIALAAPPYLNLLSTMLQVTPGGESPIYDSRHASGDAGVHCADRFALRYPPRGRHDWHASSSVYLATHAY